MQPYQHEPNLVDIWISFMAHPLTLANLLNFVHFEKQHTYKDFAKGIHQGQIWSARL